MGQLWLAIRSAMPYTFWEPKMTAAVQKVALTFTGPGPSFLKY